jgi:hypothetical protein
MVNKKSRNPFRINGKPYKFCEIANVNWDTGFSDIITLDELIARGLDFGNGGDWCRGDGTVGKIFNIDRKKIGGKIISVQLQGYKKNVFERSIAKHVRDFYKNKPCALLCIAGQFIELDHKDGRYDEFLKMSDNVTDYQPLHKSANDAKRTHCLRCKSTNIKFDARLMGYSVPQWIGGEFYNGSCMGCFWYDPVEFNAQVSNSFKKLR